MGRPSCAGRSYPFCICSIGLRGRDNLFDALIRAERLAYEYHHDCADWRDLWLVTRLVFERLACTRLADMRLGAGSMRGDISGKDCGCAKFARTARAGHAGGLGERG